MKYDPFAQQPFGEPEFADNPEPRCPCLLLLDTSGSMHGNPIRELNAGLKTFQEELLADSLSAKRVEVALVTFGPVQVMSDFVSAGAFYPPQLSAQSDTPMGRAIEEGLSLLQSRKETYQRNGIAYYRPWVFLITDGAPTDSWKRASEMIRQGEVNSSFSFFAVGVEGARMDTLGQIVVREPLKLQGLRFSELFSWLSNSLNAVSRSSVGDQVPLTPPSGWAAV